ncbi:LOW QUALITY PROTEIN: hypothetical protein V2J09_017219 [Rumex salicifolius]
MGSSLNDSWIKEYNESAKLAEDIHGMLSEKATPAPPGSELQRYFSSARRKITILGTRLDSLEALLSKLPSKQPITDKELNRRKEMISNLRAKTRQMASALSMSNFARDSLLGPEIKPADAMTRVAGLDNQGIVSLQRQNKTMDLRNWRNHTKHIALAVNEELDLQTGLIDTLDYHVDATVSRLQRVARSLAVLNRRAKGSCSCLCLMLSVAGIVILVLVVWISPFGLFQLEERQELDTEHNLIQ